MVAVPEHGTVKTEPPKSDPGLTTRFERNAIPGVERALNNTAATVYALAERGAELIAEPKRRLSHDDPLELS